jgi:hypothetical protein
VVSRKHFVASFAALLIIAGASVQLAGAATHARDRQASVRASARSVADPCADYPPVQLYSSEDPSYQYPTYVSTDGRNTFHPAAAVAPFPGWANPPIPPSTWVSPTADSSSGQTPFDYYYRVSVFKLPVPNSSRTFSVAGKVLADNQTDVEYNGHVIPSSVQPGGSPSSNFRNPWPFSVSGVNGLPGTGEFNIDFKVTDTGGPATGLDYSMTVTCQSTLGTLCVLKYEDKNGNGVQDAGEAALPGWVFTVNTSPATTLTSGAQPVCVSVPAGTYTVTETAQSGWVATAPPSGTQSVTVTAGQTVQLKFGNRIVPGELCVVKYWDRNGDGTQQLPLEGDLTGWTINVTAGPSAPFSLTTATKPSCMSVNPGTYTLTEVQQAGWVATAPATGTQTATVTTAVTTVVKFGNKKKGRRCVKLVGTFLAGKVDNFSLANGLEPATKPSTFGTLSYFDQTRANLGFWQEFRLNQLNTKLRKFVFCRARLEIRVKPLLPAPPGTRSGNDAITLSTGGASGPLRRSWSQYFGEGPPMNPWAHFGATQALLSPPTSIWEKPHPAVPFGWTWDDLNLGLPPGAGGTDSPLSGPQLGTSLFTKFKFNPHVLDVYVEDDTSVDYIKLTVWR